MKMQVSITHLPSGKTSKTEVVEVTEREYIDQQVHIYKNIVSLEYLLVGDEIWPGDLIRSSCVISIYEVK